LSWEQEHLPAGRQESKYRDKLIAYTSVVSTCINFKTVKVLQISPDEETMMSRMN